MKNLYYELDQENWYSYLTGTAKCQGLSYGKYFSTLSEQDFPHPNKRKVKELTGLSFLNFNTELPNLIYEPFEKKSSKS